MLLRQSSARHLCYYGKEFSKRVMLLRQSSAGQLCYCDKELSKAVMLLRQRVKQASYVTAAKSSGWKFSLLGARLRD
jgi:hypothetical protein